ncbi:hypothetical protein BCR43DRAFT_545392 [Syncephalastrum racemosum]|uniref:Uncharacterized protein n=1 Tax=Syncephalastrum racemosum TaxID=13706 RepID=A0A1X2HEB3_SYNRA|nr:hypothetical protein BCR43DRAFT_545392 [Syncephalastrum racemosum]
MVIIVHFTVLYYRPATVNRVSLRLIVFATVWDTTYCGIQMAIQYVMSGNQLCRVLIFINVASELISTLALTMIGVNLVMVFIVHVSRPKKYEKYYYFTTVLIAIICVIPPATVWRAKSLNREWTCWYQYYYVSRLTSEDQWLWYYSWLLFAIVVSTICAALSIHRLSHEKNIFTGALDMGIQTEESDPYYRQRRGSRGVIKTTSVFRKVAVRCACYPIRLLVSIVYFTDPAVQAVMLQWMKMVKRRYVDEYYCLLLQNNVSDGSRSTSGRPDSASRPSTMSYVVQHPHSSKSARSSYLMSGSMVEKSMRAESMMDRAADGEMHPETFVLTRTESGGRRQSIIVAGLSSRSRHGYSRSRRRNTLPQLQTTTPGGGRNGESEALGNGNTIADIREVSTREMADASASTDEDDGSDTERHCFGSCVFSSISSLSTFSSTRMQRYSGTDRLSRRTKSAGTSQRRQRTSGAYSRMGQPSSADTTVESNNNNNNNNDDRWPPPTSNRRLVHAFSDSSRGRSIPMHRVSDGRNVMSLNNTEIYPIAQRRYSEATTISTQPHGNGEGIEMIEPYPNPMFAMTAHWIFVHVLRLAPVDQQARHVGTDATSDVVVLDEEALLQPPGERGTDQQQRPQGYKGTISPLPHNGMSPRTMTPLSIASAVDEEENGSYGVQPEIVHRAKEKGLLLKMSQLQPATSVTIPTTAQDSKGKQPIRSNQFLQADEYLREPGMGHKMLEPSAQPDDREGRFMLTVTDTTTGEHREEDRFSSASDTRSLSDKRPPNARPTYRLFQRKSDSSYTLHRLKGQEALQHQKQPSAQHTTPGRGTSFFNVLRRDRSNSISVFTRLTSARAKPSGPPIPDIELQEPPKPPKQTVSLSPPKEPSPEQQKQPTPPDETSPVGKTITPTSTHTSDESTQHIDPDTLSTSVTTPPPDYHFTYPIPLEPRPKQRAQRIPAQPRIVTMPSFFLEEDFGLYLPTPPPPDTAQDMDEVSQALQHEIEVFKGFDEGVTSVVFITGWEDDQTDRVLRFEEPWGIDIMLERQLQYL